MHYISVIGQHIISQSVCATVQRYCEEPLVQGAVSGGWRGQVGLVNFKCFWDSNKQVEIVVECDCSVGLGRLYSPQRRVVFYMLLAYIETESPGLISFEMRRDWGSLSGHRRKKPAGLTSFILFTISSICSDWRCRDRNAFFISCVENTSSLSLL